MTDRTPTTAAGRAWLATPAGQIVTGMRDAILAIEAEADDQAYERGRAEGLAAGLRDANERLAEARAPLEAECPHCVMEHVWPCPTIPRCDEPGCDNETSCGWPSPAGYRRTCGVHYRAALEEPTP